MDHMSDCLCEFCYKHKHHLAAKKCEQLLNELLQLRNSAAQCGNEANKFVKELLHVLATHGSITEFENKSSILLDMSAYALTCANKENTVYPEATIAMRNLIHFELKKDANGDELQVRSAILIPFLKQIGIDASIENDHWKLQMEAAFWEFMVDSLAAYKAANRQEEIPGIFSEMVEIWYGKKD